jgi:DNA primase
MTNVAEEIKLLGLGLNHGESVLEHCPFCKATHEKTFSVTRDGAALLFNCYRASCGESGLIYTSGSPKKLDRKQFTSRPFTKPVRELDEVERLDLESRWYTHNADWKITTDEDWLVIPTKDASGYVWGTYIKRVPWKFFTGKKTILYTETEFPPHLHFPYPLTSTQIVLVEDPISANRVPNGVALLGTHVKKETLIYLKRLGIEHIDFALDFDAVKKAVKASREAGTMFSTKVLVWDSKVDPKDMTRIEFNAVFREGE